MSRAVDDDLTLGDRPGPSASGSGCFSRLTVPCVGDGAGRFLQSSSRLLLAPATGRDGRAVTRGAPSLPAYGIVGQFAGCGWSMRIPVLVVPGGRR